jgi:hypothetical protein
MRFGQTISSFFSHYSNTQSSQDSLMVMAEASLRRQFNRFAPQVLDAVIERKTISVDLVNLMSHMVAFNTLFMSHGRTLEEQQKTIENFKPFQDLKSLAESRGLDLVYRVDSIDGQLFPVSISADITLAPFKSEAVQRCAATRIRAPHWPCNPRGYLPPAWTGKQGTLSHS